MLVKIPLYASSFWLKISKKPQLYKNTASFFKNFYLKNILHKVSLFSENATDEMDFYQIKLEYQRIFDFIDNSIFEKISTEIESIYQEYIFYIQDYKIKGGTLGRGNLKWGRNIIWSWFIEKIFLHILQQNNCFKSVRLYGGDSSHLFLYDKVNKIITIEGEKTTKPDLICKNHQDQEFCIELKTAAKGIFSIKKGNIDQLYKDAGQHDRITLIIMIDLENKLYQIKNLQFFHNKQPFINQRMEGQLCYEFPHPDLALGNIINHNLIDLLDYSILNIEDVKKYKSLKIAEIRKDLKMIKLITNKIKIDKIIFEKNLQDQDFASKMQKIINKSPEVIKTEWSAIFALLEI